MESEIIHVNAEQLRKLMASRKESDYLLVDVRQPQEYLQSHIPGSRLFPLPELQAKPFDLPSGRDLVFYCRSGGRSAYAADLANEAEVTNGKIFNLTGGVLAWEGRLLADAPRVMVFARAQSPESMLMTAMDLEKGAQRFYQYLEKKYADAAFHEILEQLSKAEKGHARAIYTFWSRMVASAPDFESLYDGLAGEILEGGQNLEDALAGIEKQPGIGCLNLLEMALTIEYAAYDLYRSMAERTADSTAQQAFLTIAQAEKGHMKSITRAIDQCA